MPGKFFRPVGKIAHRTGSSARFLESETLIGRGAQCTLRLNTGFASSQHAVMRWVGEAWCIWDLGSRNGTWLNGERLESRKRHTVTEGAQLCFGHPEDPWDLVSSAAPVVMVVNVVTGEQIVVNGPVQGIPSDDSPLVTLYQDVAGVWVMDPGDGPPKSLANGAAFEAGKEVWRFCYPDAATKTVTANLDALGEPPCLHFFVSSDEEYVELQLESPQKTVQLGSRAQNYLLLTLARARLRDRAANIAETSCGWLYKEDLSAGLEAAQRVDLDVFRIRKHLAQIAPELAASIVERRHRTRQLRIGLARLKITQG